jgi:hypothetical protein
MTNKLFIFTLIIIALVMALYIKVASPKIESAHCENLRYQVENYPMQWTEAIQEMCGDFINYK